MLLRGISPVQEQAGRQQGRQAGRRRGRQADTWAAERWKKATRPAGLQGFGCAGELVLHSERPKGWQPHLLISKADCQRCQSCHAAQLFPRMGSPAPALLELQVEAPQLQQLCAHAVECQRHERCRQGVTLHSHVQGVELGQPVQCDTCSNSCTLIAANSSALFPARPGYIGKQHMQAQEQAGGNVYVSVCVDGGGGAQVGFLRRLPVG